jgi:DNA-3-methyladenine glycosylase
VHDPASHAWQGRRHGLNLGIYASPGTWYVYRSYGIHWCLNLTCEPEGEGAAVLIRGLRPWSGIEAIQRRRGPVQLRRLTDGPGKLAQALAITGDVDGMRATPDAPLRLVGRRYDNARVTVTPRIGITRAADWPLRFLLTTGD